MHDHIDLDPRPSRSPLLYAEVEDVRGRLSSSISLSHRKPAESRLRSQRIVVAVKAMREHNPPVPHSIIAVTLEISERHSKRVWKSIQAKMLRKSRV